MEGDGGGDDDQGPSTGRSRRNRQDKSGRSEALERLKNLRGSKNKYEVKEMENVYDTVDEGTYSRKVQDRQRDDWIVDDGSGYVEDGREIFDDDMIDDEEDARHRRKPRSKKEKEDKKLEKEAQRASYNSLRDMLSAMPVKRKRPEGNGLAESSQSSLHVTEDDMLEDLMKELHEEKKPRISVQPNGHVFERKKPSRAVEDDVLGDLMKELQEEKKPRISGQFKGLLVEKTKLVENFVEEAKIRKSIPVPFATSRRNESPPPLPSLSPIHIFNEDLPEESKELHIENIPIKIEPADGNLSEKTQLVESFLEDAMIIISESDQVSATSSHEGGEENMTLNFFWLDMFEEPRNPGCLYLFGKVPSSAGTFSSCCVVVKDLKRCIYVLPRETDEDGNPVSFLDVYNEFNDVISPKYKISSFLSKKSERKYCFGQPNVPRVAEYFEVRYPGSMPAIPSDLSGKTFSRVFGSNSPLMESFLLDKKLKGPSWLLIKNPESVDAGQQQSWCKMEFNCEVRDIEINPEVTKAPPPIVLVSLNIQAVNDATSKKDTIVFVGVAVNTSFPLQSALSSNVNVYHDFFCLVNKPIGEIWPLDVDRIVNKRTIKMDSERAMLGCLLAKLQQIDADAYLGHDLNFELLLMHLFNQKVPHWSRIGRLKRTTHIGKTGKTLDYRTALAGRLLCDIKISAMELVRARSYDQASLASQILGIKEEQVASMTGPEIKKLYDSSDGLRYLVKCGMQHCVLNIKLVNELQVFPLALQITTIAGNTLCRTLLGGRSERNEFLLLHAFHSKGYIVPDKYKLFLNKGVKNEDEGDVDGDGKKTGNSGKKNSGPSYLGGLVLDPKKGFYDNFIVLMDFNSLYPSIIQEYNICFTTTLNSDNFEGDDKNKGILPEEIRKLVESRRQVKSLMKGSDVPADLMRQYDIRQKALKLTANSMYGCLGFRNSRFYAQELAAMITGKGREILLKTKDAVEGMGFEVIYGDTDSLMINTNIQDIQKVYQIGNKIKSEINRMYKLLELEIDGVFRFLLLLKKKKYAALVYTPNANGDGGETSLELKGLDMVRRDWAPIAASTARLVLDEIMTEQNLDDKIFKICKILKDTATKLRTGTDLALKELLITKQLAKNPEEYKDAQGLHHVKVALQMNKLGTLPKKFRNGDTVSYLFCKDGLPHHLAELTKRPVKADTSEETEGEVIAEKEEVDLKPDPQYYLAHQVHPVVSRICDPIPGLDPARIAEELGMDPTSFKRHRVVEDSREDKLLGEQTEAEKYMDCDRFSFSCLNQECRDEIVIHAPFSIVNSEVVFPLQKCPKCSTSLLSSQNLNHVCNSLVLFMRKSIIKYYKGTYVCEDPSCTVRERTVPLKLDKGRPVCSCTEIMCKEYSDAQLYKQLTYLRYVFDMDKHTTELNPTELTSVQIARKTDVGQLMESSLVRLNDAVTRFLNCSGYSEIKLGYLFQDLFPK